MVELYADRPIRIQLYQPSLEESLEMAMLGRAALENWMGQVHHRDIYYQLDRMPMEQIIPATWWEWNS